MSIKTFMYEKFTDLSNMMTNPLSTSKFLEEGVLTPEEFVQAGDLLVLKTPSWSWQPGNAKLGLQKGLPKEKHYLITRNVQCSMRVSALEAKCNNTENKDVETEDGEGGWVQTHTNEINTNDDEIPEIVTDQKKSDEDDSDDEDAPEIDLSSLSFKEDIKDDDEATLSQNVVKTRTYDISICYDQYHQTPRVWLFGYDENKQPLKPEQVLQDISQEHVNKTVTIAAHPHTGVPQAYIHPCRHAAVMKKVVQRMIESGKVPRIDQYLFLFLKFIHAAIPTIEYDYTFQMDLQ